MASFFISIGGPLDQSISYDVLKNFVKNPAWSKRPDRFEFSRRNIGSIKTEI